MIRNHFKKLEGKITELRKGNSMGGNIIFYLSTPPNLYSIIPQNLAALN